ncbi:MAG: ABC transporter permease [Deltaproteobacteria bacterium]|nr:ABC transporter permease [Deltaproteobacteria bacterium]
MSDVFTLAFLAQLIRIAVPYALAAMGGAITERSGVIDLALEAKLLFGAFAAAAFAHSTGSAYAGVAGGMMAGVAVTGVQLFCSLRLRADQVIVGVALNVIALGGTRFLLQLIYHEGANSPQVPAFGHDVVTNPIVWLAFIAAVALPFALVRTRWGLRLRAAGDRPDSLVTVGVAPSNPRIYAALVGGALTGAGGAQLTLSVGGFVADMSGGRGYIALAMVILAGWRPALAAVACAGIAFAEAFNIQLQVSDVGIPNELAQLVPYVLTLLVLAIAGGKHGKPPRSLGKL